MSNLSIQLLTHNFQVAEEILAPPCSNTTKLAVFSGDIYLPYKTTELVVDVQTALWPIEGCHTDINNAPYFWSHTMMYGVLMCIYIYIKTYLIKCLHDWTTIDTHRKKPLDHSNHIWKPCPVRKNELSIWLDVSANLNEKQRSERLIEVNFFLNRAFNV